MTEPVPDQAVPGPELAGPTDPAGWLTLPDVAERLDVSISKVHQMIRDRELLAVRRDGVRRIPADLVANETVLKHLPGVLNLLSDNGYDDEAVAALALRAGRHPPRRHRRSRPRRATRPAR